MHSAVCMHSLHSLRRALCVMQAVGLGSRRQSEGLTTSLASSGVILTKVTSHFSLLTSYFLLLTSYLLLFGVLGGDIDYFTHTRDGRADWWEGDRPAPTFATLPDGRLNETEYATSRFEEESIRWLSEAQRRAGKPFLQLLAFNAPHSPMQALTKDLSAPECRHLSHGRAVRPRAKGWSH